MAFLETLLAAAASKAGVAAAGAVLTVTGVGTAAVTGNLPADIQTQVDELIGAERGDDESTDVVDSTEIVESTEAVETEVVESEAEVVENEAEVVENEAENETDADGGNEVSEAATTAGEGLEGRERGEAISGAVRDANGSADKGQAEERRAEAATRAEAGRANADDAGGADAAADAETDPAEREADAADKAAAGQANADAAEGDDDLEADDADDTEAADADDARQDADRRPEGAGAPGSEG